MPYKRKGLSPNYYIRLRALPGYGDSRPISTKQRSKRVAVSMERMLLEIASAAMSEKRYRDLLDGICGRLSDRIAITDVYVAWNAKQLDSFIANRQDLVLADAIVAWKGGAQPSRVTQIGADLLLELAPPGARLSFIADTGRLRALAVEAERQGRKRASIRRGLLQAASGVLTHHLGRAERNRVFADLNFAAGERARIVTISPADVRSLLDACNTLASRPGPHKIRRKDAYSEFALALQIALATGADRGTIWAGSTPNGEAPGMRWNQILIDDSGSDLTGTVLLEDTKTLHRRRTVRLPSNICEGLLGQARRTRTAEDALVFATPYSGVDGMWRRVRKEAGLDRLRLKDLRHGFAVAASRAGIAQVTVQNAMGHASAAQTRAYQLTKASLSPQQANAVAEELGIG